MKTRYELSSLAKQFFILGLVLFTLIILISCWEDEIDPDVKHVIIFVTNKDKDPVNVEIFRGLDRVFNRSGIEDGKFSRYEGERGSYRITVTASSGSSYHYPKGGDGSFPMSGTEHFEFENGEVKYIPKPE